MLSSNIRKHPTNKMTIYCLWISQFWLVVAQSLVLQAQPLKDGAPFVLFGLRQHITRFELDGSDLRHYLSRDDGLIDVVGVDTDIRAGRIFWSDVSTKQIYQADIDQTAITNLQRLLQENTSVIEGVAWDWVNHKLYWTALGDATVDSTIEVMDTDTGCRKVLARFDDGTKPRAIVLDPVRGWMFWSDFNMATSKIVRMSMDGTNSTVLLDEDTVKFPNGLSLDYATQTLFWIDAGTDEIGTIHIDGTERRKIADVRVFYRAPHPFALEFYREELYFSDWKWDSMWKLTLLNSDKNISEVKSFSFDPTTIHVVDIARQPMRPGGNPCSENNRGCSHLCLLSSTSLGYACVIPDNSLACTAPRITPKATPIDTTGSADQSESCQSGEICNTGITVCKEGFTVHDFTHATSGIQIQKMLLLESFSVSGTVFLGVQGILVVVIIMIFITIIAIVCLFIKRSNGKRNHSIANVNKSSPQSGPRHEMIRSHSECNYIRSAEYPVPTTIILNIGNHGGSPTDEQSLIENNHPSQPHGMDVLIQTIGQACNITNESAHGRREKQSNRNTVNGARGNTMENVTL